MDQMIVNPVMLMTVIIVQLLEHVIHAIMGLFWNLEIHSVLNAPNIWSAVLAVKVHLSVKYVQEDIIS